MLATGNVCVGGMSGAMKDALKHALSVTKSMEYLLATGNLASKTGLGLMQVRLYPYTGSCILRPLIEPERYGLK